VADDPKGKVALALWLEQRDDLLAGRVPRSSQGALTLHGLCNAFAASKESQRDCGDITARTFGDYLQTCQLLLDSFGKTRRVDDLVSADFEGLRKALAKRLGPHALGRQIVQSKTVFRYGYEAGLIESPVRYGPTFKPPARRILRTAKQAAAPKLFEAREIRRLLRAAPPQLRAMILLAVNCGFGNADCGRLPLAAVDLRKGWIDYPCGKTAIERRCPL
jgi:integrase